MGRLRSCGNQKEVWYENVLIWICKKEECRDILKSIDIERAFKFYKDNRILKSKDKDLSRVIQSKIECNSEKLGKCCEHGLVHNSFTQFGILHDRMFGDKRLFDFKLRFQTYDLGEDMVLLKVELDTYKYNLQDMITTYHTPKMPKDATYFNWRRDGNILYFYNGVRELSVNRFKMQPLSVREFMVKILDQIIKRYNNQI